ncbi:TetR/AcrR family transcriptional regulator [Streptomyces sp. SHP 1-2]|uniref:TetR/AcrR family transcriptional regulator n=1 Tax=Streptomyces sp. SHP 1-2 TaxID=2769489 RepID=UPI0022380132|nr:TetR/AcrR family transcriptional regulator [Streptomyces sp. SHP 1-2]MCW5249030.1 TetR/AcrR family transcriptional regulator [Streptomyces sp. SHP 1-2]
MASARSEAVADAAIAVLADQGVRGLTHRAVDNAAGLPIGSTSNHARTRAALLKLALVRLAAVEADDYTLAFDAPAPVPAGSADSSAENLVDVVTHALVVSLTTGRQTTLARFELALEASRRPELRQLYSHLGRKFQLAMVDLLARAGSRAPVADAHMLMSACEGILFYWLVGSGSAQAADQTEIRHRVRGLVHMLVDGHGGN